MSELLRIIDSETALAQAEEKFAQTKRTRENLKQRRNDGKLLYNSWQGSNDWHQWRIQQLEHQGWKCACCSKQMGFGEKTYLDNGDFTLEPHHPTVDHILPKSFFPELTLDKQNLVMVCWSCNRKKSNSVAIASRMRHQKLEQRRNIKNSSL
ncbi:HNH endonuclease [Leptolyngbya sp. FACHB-671]|uniref:HNH endonuclease n=1 Tax=Leptolyngbya sp. FACHB-671 TaxID=2692812 RepID=UPI0016854772|nr:HNH endonuclease signature motif containing protein [Leptolyngbya sp. FACHB-671]MBD2068912.1 HNH endonuclease [Leptolyngbya sp. FACHB-671]